MSVTHGGASRSVASAGNSSSLHVCGTRLGLTSGPVTWPQWPVLRLSGYLRAPSWGVDQSNFRWQSAFLGARAVTKIASRALEWRQSHLTTSQFHPLTAAPAAYPSQAIELANGRLAGNDASKHNIGYHFQCQLSFGAWAMRSTLRPFRLF